jgi:hypothetical protein
MIMAQRYETSVNNEEQIVNNEEYISAPAANCLNGDFNMFGMIL